MTNKEIINLIEDALEIDANTLTEETKLDDIEELDSLGKLTLITLFDDEFDKELKGEHLIEFKTIKDLLDFLA